jgi:hypothetical protein
MTEKTVPEIVEDAASARDILNAAVVHEAFDKLRQQAIQDIIDATRRGLTAAPACAILVALEDLIHELKLTETEEVLLRKNRFRRVR